jgi:hypothetical protein
MTDVQAVIRSALLIQVKGVKAKLIYLVMLHSQRDVATVDKFNVFLYRRSDSS